MDRIDRLDARKCVPGVLQILVSIMGLRRALACFCVDNLSDSSSAPRLSIPVEASAGISPRELTLIDCSGLLEGPRGIADTCTGTCTGIHQTSLGDV